MFETVGALVAYIGDLCEYMHKNVYFPTPPVSDGAPRATASAVASRVERRVHRTRSSVHRKYLYARIGIYICIKYSARVCERAV